MSFEGSSLWRVRQRVGNDLLLWPGATVLVEDADGRILLGLRRDNGEWAMPGGGAEEGGSFASTALTEPPAEANLMSTAAAMRSSLSCSSLEASASSEYVSTSSPPSKTSLGAA